MLELDKYIHPRVDPEIAFLMKAPLAGEVTRDEVMNAVEAIAPTLEIIDSRFRNFRFSLVDVVADHCSSTGYVLGPWLPYNIGLSDLRMALFLDGAQAKVGSSSAILGDPVNSLIEAARCLGHAGKSLESGQILLADAATKAIPLAPGQSIDVQLESLASCGFKTKSA